MNTNIRANIYFMGLLVLALLFTVYFGFLKQPFYTHPHAVLRQGQLNLNHVPAQNHDKLFAISGEAEFYWKQLLTPNDFAQGRSPVPDAYAPVPGLWNGLVVGADTLPSFGYATYRFVVQVPNNSFYGIKIKEMDCAYRIYVNGVVDSSGVVDSCKAGYRPSWQRREVFFMAQDNRVEVVLQIANFHHRKGGPEDTMYLGKAMSIGKQKQNQFGLELFICGVIFIIACYHLGLWSLRDKGASTLWFGVFCLVMSVRLLTTGEKILVNLFPEASWLLLIRIEYCAMLFTPPTMLMFMHRLYPGSFYKQVVVGLNAAAGGMALFVLLSPVYYFTFTPLYYQVLVLAVSIYTMVVAARLLVRKQPNSLIFFIGYACYFLLFVNELLHYNKVIKTDHMLHFGIFMFIFAQSHVLARMFSQAFTDNEDLLLKLEGYSHNLEEMVLNRTGQIEQQKTEIQEQAINLKEALDKLRELDRFKDGLTGMIVHDLKNPLNAIINLPDEHATAEDVELAKQAGKQMLNMVVNLLDVQKFEDARMKLDVVMESLRVVAEMAIEQVVFLAQQRRVCINNMVDTDCVANFDFDIIERVFVNLLTNAIKFSPDRGIIDVGCQQDGAWLKLYVKDQGMGVAPEHQGLVFEKFVQVDNRKSGRASASGLGLNFCKLAVEAHEGQIGLVSAPEQGTTFWFTLAKPADLDLPSLDSLAGGHGLL